MEVEQKISLPADERFLRRPDVEKLIGSGKNFIYSTPDFPRPIQLTTRFSVWLESEVRAWMTNRVAAALAQRKAAQ